MATDQLERARALPVPGREATLHRDPSVQQFWTENRDLLEIAWEEWDGAEQGDRPALDSSLLDARLRAAVDQAWTNPDEESAVRALLDEAAPNVYCFQFFDPERLADLRAYLEAAWDVNINTPGEDFSGSSVDFFDRPTDQVNSLMFEPGMAMIHRGDVPHTAQPITSGSRTNLVLWLYGDHGQVPRHLFGEPAPASDLTPQERWTTPSAPLDGFAPF